MDSPPPRATASSAVPCVSSLSPAAASSAAPSESPPQPSPSKRAKQELPEQPEKQISEHRKAHWQHQPADADHLQELLGQMDISETLAEILVQKQLPADAIEDWLQPRARQLSDPFAIAHLKEAAERLSRAIDEQADVLIVGDYDVDGISSTALLADILEKLGLKTRRRIPRRQSEGYGLTEALLARILENPPQILLALDCGTNETAIVESLRKANVECIIIDHHQKKEGEAPNALIVNPHLFDPPEAPWAKLASVGLSFKLAHGILQHRRGAGCPKADKIELHPYLELVALGTLADLVPLIGENRILAKIGMQKLSKTKRQGLRALLKISQLDHGLPLDSSDITFQLAPRINAAGRMAEADLAVELLLESDATKCRELARELDAHNKERRHVENAIYQAAKMQMQNQDPEAPGIIVHSDQWHAGVLGIVAGRLTREFHKPVIVLHSQSGVAQGSGRSIHGINLQSILQACDAKLTRWGGHKMAVGLTLETRQLPAFTKIFQAILAQKATEIPPKKLDIHAWIKPHELHNELIGELDTLQPFGQSAPQPTLGLELKLQKAPQIFGKNGEHCRMQIPSANGTLNTIGWRMAHKPPPPHQKLQLALRVQYNTFGGRRVPQAECIDWRYAQAQPTQSQPKPTD